MLLSTLNPYELGELNSAEALDYLIIYLTKGKDNEKRLAASAIKKMIDNNINCDKTVPFLIKNLGSKKPQIRQYTLKTLSLLTIPSELKEHLYREFSKEDKEYNIQLYNEIFKRLPNFNELELINYSVIQNIANQSKQEIRDKSGFVYFIQESFSNTIKIGKTKNLKDRMENFGVKLPFEIKILHTIKTENMDYTEKLFHIHFDKKRVNGEWFNLSISDIQWIIDGIYTNKIALSIGKEERIREIKENLISKKQLEYLVSLLQQNNYPINFPLNTLTSKQASDLINLIHSEKTKKIEG